MLGWSCLVPLRARPGPGAAHTTYGQREVCPRGGYGSRGRPQNSQVTRRVGCVIATPLDDHVPGMLPQSRATVNLAVRRVQVGTIRVWHERG